jgi:4-aminobutyrate aminotransferase-like enzyme
MAVNDPDLPYVASNSIPGAKSLAWAQRLSSVESPDTTFLSDDFPIFWTRASGCLVYDDDGNRYLDLTSSFGVLGVGHNHPRVVEAITQQSSRLIHGMGDVHPSTVKVELLEKIAHFSPIPQPLITLGLNGADAVEAAIKTAMLATGKPGVLGFVGGYHGLSYGALELTDRGFFRDAFFDQRGRFATHLPFGCDPEQIRTAVFESALPIGAVIVEPVQGRAGVRIPPHGWLSSLRSLCTELGVLLIFDEIFTGWGRTGEWFACLSAGAIPDLLCIGKGMGGGMPISACLGSTTLMQSAWARSTGEARHTYTFLGQPLACAAAIATISVLEEDDLVNRSKELGVILLSSLKSLATRYPHIIKGVRGQGTMLAIEFLRPENAWLTVQRGLTKGLILLPAGPSGEAVEIVPPFTISHRQIDYGLDTLDRLLSGLTP